MEKHGLGLKPHAEGSPCALTPTQMDEKQYPHVYPSYQQSPVHCGLFNRALSHAGERRFEMLDVTMSQIAEFLGQQMLNLGLQPPLGIVDRTGLEGHYDAVLEVAPGYVGVGSDPGDEVGAPMLPTALEKQLGLKLDKQNAQVDFFVTDHMGTLSDN